MGKTRRRDILPFPLILERSLRLRNRRPRSHPFALGRLFGYRHGWLRCHIRRQEEAPLVHESSCSDVLEVLHWKACSPPSHRNFCMRLIVYTYTQIVAGLHLKHLEKERKHASLHWFFCHHRKKGTFCKYHYSYWTPCTTTPAKDNASKFNARLVFSIHPWLCPPLNHYKILWTKYSYKPRPWPYLFEVTLLRRTEMTSPLLQHSPPTNYSSHPNGCNTSIAGNVEKTTEVFTVPHRFRSEIWK